MLETQDYASICTMGRRNSSRNDNYKKSSYTKQDNKPARNTQMRKACLGIGHCITNPNTIYYNVANHQMCAKYLDIAEHIQSIKSNTFRYKKYRKDKASRAKTSLKMEGFMRMMEDAGHDPKEITPIINIARALALHLDIESSDADRNSSERQTHVEDKTPPAIQDMSDKPPAEPPPPQESTVYEDIHPTEEHQ